MIGFIKSIQSILVALVIGLLVGGVGGYYVKSRFVKADQVKPLIEARKDDVQSVEDMRKEEGKLQSKTEATRNNNTAIRVEAAKHEAIVFKVEGNGLKPEGMDICGTPVLGLATVGLLNAARENRPFDPASIGDGAGDTPSDIEVEDLIDNDLEIVGKYHDLADRHNSLVDWAEKEIKKHNARVQSGN